MRTVYVNSKLASCFGLHPQDRGILMVEFVPNLFDHRPKTGYICAFFLKVEGYIRRMIAELKTKLPDLKSRLDKLARYL